jgi:hypothetical protein
MHTIIGRSSRAGWLLVVSLALAAAACSEAAPPDESVASDVEAGSGALTVDERAAVKAIEISLATPLNKGKPQLRVKPVLECVEMISKRSYVAHFGWDNTSAETVTIPVGPINRILPAPKDRGQGTTFAKGRQKDRFQVPFTDAFVAWIVDGRYAVAVKSSPRCPAPPPSCPDGAACKTSDGKGGSCRGGVCMADLICTDDGNPCTDDVIAHGVCTHPPRTDGTVCSDGDPFSDGDRCLAGACAALVSYGRMPACLSCEQDAISAGDCERDIGCSHIADPADRALCDAVDRCIRRTRCSAHDPIDCLCGTALGIACAGPAANGACRAEIQAATKTTDPVGNGTRFYSLAFPAGFATQQASCDRDFCPNQCGVSVCQPSGLDCDDHDPCTVDRCLTGGGCGHDPGNNGGACTAPSGGASSCADGKCFDPLCHSYDPCKIAIFRDGACVIANAPDGTTCNDGLNCTTSDVCSAGTCNGQPVVCPLVPGCADQPICSAAAGGRCVLPPGSQCGRGVACVACEQDGITSGACEQQIGCEHIADPGDRALCEALDACIQRTGCWRSNAIDCLCGTAKGATCAGPAANGPCKAEVQAATKSLDPLRNGTLFFDLQVPAGYATQRAQCDHDACPIDCAWGTCPAGGPNCDDKNPCTNDGCLSGGGCGHAPGRDGVACTAGNGAAGICSKGVCQDPLCQSSNPCQVATVSNGACVTSNAPDGTPCSDGLKCTERDVCSNGTCQGQTVVCPAPLACSGPPSCTEAGGGCVYPPGSGCGRGPACLACEQSAVASTDFDPRIGCSNISDAGDRALCQALDDCIRRTGCWQGDPISCLCGTALGTACGGPAANGACKSQVQAATKSTDPIVNGTLYYSFLVPAGFATQQAAADHDMCSAECGSVSCPAGGAECDDKNPCTVDGCLAGGGCGHTAGRDGATCTTASGASGACSKGTCLDVACTSNDPCKVAARSNGACVISPAPDGTACGGGLPCASGDFCVAGICKALNPRACDRSVGCRACEQSAINAGDCDTKIGCDQITDAADRSLCVALDACMRKTGCWSVDPLDCLCGTAKGTACAGPAANGVCKAQIQAATKTTDPVANGTLFYDFRVPAAFATQQAACDLDFCPAICKPLAP